MRRGILSEDSFEAALELESGLSLRRMGVGGPSDSKLHSRRMDGGVGSDLLFPRDACFGIFIWVMENMRWSALACVSCSAVMVCGSMLLMSGVVSERKRSMFAWSSSA